MPLLGLIALFIVVPLAELYVILQVGEAIGAVWTILLLAADSLLGSILLRSQGRAVWKRFNETLAAGAMPHKEVVDGVLVVFGGAFLITPGFLTDIVGVTFLLPPSRALVRRALMRRLSRRVSTEFGVRRTRTGRPGDVEGSATEYDAPAPRLER